jgi:hypothetical protein
MRLHMHVRRAWQPRRALPMNFAPRVVISECDLEVQLQARHVVRVPGEMPL